MSDDDIAADRHGTRSRYSSRGCRCDDCKRANKRYHNELRARLAQTPFEKIPHGLSGYKNYGCRCQICFDAQSEANRKAHERRAKAATGVPVPAPAGSDAPAPREPRAPRQQQDPAPGEAPTTDSRPLWPHQHAAVNAAVAELEHADRTQIIAACGTGKTITGAEVSRRIAPDGRVLIVVPTLELLAQTASSYAKHLGPAAGRIGAVCSEVGATITAADMHRELTALHVGVSTDPAAIAGWLTAPGRATILCTYQSLPVIREAHDTHGAPPWDLIIIDEAHRSAGRTDRPWNIVHSAIPARRRLYMTATPRIMGSSDYESVSMDDPAVFGREAYRLAFGEAIEAGLLADYRVIVSVITDRDIHELLYRPGAHLDIGGASAPATMIAAQVALLKAARQYGLRRAITYHRRVLSAAKFADMLPDTAALLPEDQRPAQVHADWVSGEMSLSDRRAVLQRLENPGDATVVVANARVLGEGVDIPALDAVMFTDPRESPTDIVQAVGRALRRGQSTGKIATIIIPLLVADAEADAAALDGSTYDTVWRTIRALRAHDERLADWLDTERVRVTTKNAPHVPGRIHQAPSWLVLDGDPLPSGFAQAITTRMVEAASSSWWATYGLAVQYQRHHGHLEPVEDQDPKIYHFVANSRSQHASGRLSADRAAALEKLGIVWDRAAKRWAELLAEAEAFHAEHGHLRVPQTYVSPGGYRLGSRFNTLRARTGDRIPPQVRKRLDQLGMTWSVPDADWEALLTHARAWHAEHGNLPGDRAQRCCGDYLLGAVLTGKRKLHARGALPGYQKEALDRLGMVWDRGHDRKWQAFLDACHAYLQDQRDRGIAHPVLDVPRAYLTADGYQLGKAINYYRTLHAGTKRRRDGKLTTLPADRKRVLDGLGMVWVAVAERRPVTAQELERLRSMPAGGVRSVEHRALTAAIIDLVDGGVSESSIADGLGIKRPTLNLRIKSLRENPQWVRDEPHQPVGAPAVPGPRAEPVPVAPTRPDLVPDFQAPASVDGGSGFEDSPF